MAIELWDGVRVTLTACRDAVYASDPPATRTPPVLEINLEGELNDPWVHRHRCDFAESGISQRLVRQSELGSVERVEKFASELGIDWLRPALPTVQIKTFH